MAAQWRKLCWFILSVGLVGTVSAQVWGESISVDVNSTLTIEYVKYSMPMSWEEASAKCGQAEVSPDKQHLLCFDNRAEISSIFSEKELANFSVWLSGKNCRYGGVENCLSLLIYKHHNDYAWKFGRNCNQRLGFICRKFVKKMDNLVLDESKNDVTMCPAIEKRGIKWPRTFGNTNVSLKCPQKMKGYARWFCNGTTGEWDPDEPSFADCRSVALTAVLQKVEEELENPRSDIINLQQTAQELREMMKGLQTGGDVETTVAILDKVEDIFVSQAPAMSTEQRKKMAVHTSEHVINVCDQLLTKSKAWNELSPENRTSTASTFLTAVDETGGILASSIETKKHEITTRNVVLEVVKETGTAGRTRNETFTKLVKNSLNVVIGPDTKHVVFAFYSDLRDILPSYQDIPGSQTKTINSPVISANISGGKLQGKVQVRLAHFNTTLHNATCVYWDSKRLSWSADGCSVVSSTSEYTVCECEHLTNFAILMDMSCATCELSEAHRIALAVITVIGCSVSIFCLSICVVIFTYYKTLWGMRVMIHRNLCITLIIAQAILLGGLDKTANKIVCGCIAGLMHYFFLAAFCWMFLEAFHIMWLLIKVFNPKQSHMIKFYVFGYGFPAILVAINAGFKHEGYGTPQHCWLNTQDGTIWGFIAPVIVIILFNTISLAYALYTTRRITKNKEKGHMEGIKLWVRGAAVLMPLLGVTWIVGFLYIDGNYIVFAYFFAALNSLQGLGIFFFHCLLNQKVKEHVRRSFNQSSFLGSYGRASTKVSKTTSSSSSKDSASPKRRNKSRDPPRPDSENRNSDHILQTTPQTPAQEEEEAGEQTIAFLPETDDRRDRLNTNELYPLEVEKG